MADSGWMAAGAGTTSPATNANVISNQNRALLLSIGRRGSAANARGSLTHQGLLPRAPRSSGNPRLQTTAASIYGARTQAVRKPVGTSIDSSGTSVTSTAVTLEAEDPIHSQLTKASTASGSPQASTSTRPSGRFIA